jgi:uncharacterized protein (TIGR04255 family)
VTKITSQSLPEYDNPPVIEVVCGVLFKPIETLLAPHLGLLWEKFKPEYSECKETDPLVPVIERFDEVPGGKFKISEELRLPMLPRIWFVQASGNGIIQVQRDRFLYNWRKVQLEDEYPRYHTVIQKFRDHLSVFQAVLYEAKLGTIEPLQYEMTYVNHIPQGEGWETPSDIGNIFPDSTWKVNEQRFLADPEGFNLRTSFALPEHSGRLHLTIRNAIRRNDGHPIFLFELLVRGIGNYTSLEAIWSWFDQAHEWIVQGFTDLTSSKIQNDIWRRKR